METTAANYSCVSPARGEHSDQYIIYLVALSPENNSSFLAQKRKNVHTIKRSHGALPIIHNLLFPSGFTER